MPPDTATIVVAGIVHHLEGLRGLGHIQRARWGVLAPYAARWPADLVVVGRSSAGVDAVAVIAGLKDAEATADIPVLHVAPHEVGCAECRADVCLPDVPVAGQLARVAGVLIELGEARVRSGRAPGPEPGPSARAERLQALGLLAAGAVHDFNNLLFVIGGQLELARRHLGPEHPAFTRLAPALQATERAVELNRRLLALGRGLPADPRPVGLGAVVARLEGMLQRVVGEDASLQVRAGGGPGRVLADVTELEQLVLQLVLSARDETPRGGLVSIETSQVEIAAASDAPAPPGRYAVVAVSGAGAVPEAARRIVERHEGRVRVSRAEGRGSVTEVYLPCLDDAAEA